jgi:hypothetical protein
LTRRRLMETILVVSLGYLYYRVVNGDEPVCSFTDIRGLLLCVAMQFWALLLVFQDRDRR